MLPSLPSALAVGGEHQWLDQFSASASSNAYTYSAEVALDSSGNVFAAGGGYGGAGFLVKYDGGGVRAWTRPIGAEDVAHLATDPAGNVVVVYSGYVQNVGYRSVVVKYDTAGNLLWTRQIASYAYPYGVATDSLGTIYVTGYASYVGYFLRRYDTAGTVVWTKTLSDGSGQVAVDGSGSIYVKTWSAMHKVDLSGTDIWSPPRPIPTDGTANGAFAVDASGGVYIAGSIPDPPPPGQVASGRTDTLLRKYDHDFIQVWARQFGTPADDYPGSVAGGAAGIFVTGQTTGVFPGQTLVGGSDAFVRRVDTAGQALWTFEFGTPAHEYAPSAAVRRPPPPGVSPDASYGSVFVAGTTDGAFTGHSRTSQRDAYVSRIDALGPTASGLVLTPNPVGTGNTVHLTATIDDSATGGSAITSAAYTVDGGTAVPMQASGAAFGGPVVSVEATIPAFALPGQHDICVRGTDAATNSGAVTAEACSTLTVVATAPPPPLDAVGPTTTGAVVTPNPAIAGRAMVLRAVVDDQASGGSAVVSASYRLDAGPPVSMAATDGAFGQSLEAVTASAHVAAVGVHSLCASGVDAAGNTGSEQCASLTVNPAPPPPPPAPVDTTGPATAELIATPNPAGVGAAILLSAIVDDRAAGGSGILSASYRVDGGSPVVMAASDGAFGQPVEAVRVTLSFASAGVYSVCVQGTDVAGNTGAPGCTLVTVSATAPPPPPPTLVLGETLTRPGYWMLGADGRVYSFGISLLLGQPAGSLGSAQAVDIESTPSGLGYWIVDDAGHIHAYGDAPALGGISQLPASERATSLSGTPSGRGYWIFTTAGRVFPFGDATFFGDMSSVRLNGNVLDSVATPSGLGYYMVASDGGVFSFGDAKFWGSTGGIPLNAPVRSLVADSDGAGYWLVASDGGVFAFNAPFNGSMGSVHLNQPITGMVRFGTGYLMVAGDGGIFNFSTLPFAGSLGATPPPRPIVSVAVFGG
jgi:hypothetical protein